MDAVAGLLDGPRARDAFLLRCSMDPPWSLRIQDEAPLAVVALVRGGAWIARPDAGAPGWYRAHADPIVGPALQLLHHNPAERWTVARLARETGVSRAALARRFNALVG